MFRIQRKTHLKNLDYATEKLPALRETSPKHIINKFEYFSQTNFKRNNSAPN